MKHKTKNTEKSLKQVTENLNESIYNLSKVVREDTIFSREYMEIVNIETNKVWNDVKKKNEKKAEELVKKYCIKERTPGEHKGVYIIDENI